MLIQPLTSGCDAHIRERNRVDIYRIPVKEFKLNHEIVDGMGVWGISKDVECVGRNINPTSLHNHLVLF